MCQLYSIISLTWSQIQGQHTVTTLCAAPQSSNSVDDEERAINPMQRKLPSSQRRTHWLVWCAAIICTIVAIAVIVTGIVVFVGYMVIHPRVPFISVVDAHLDNIQYDALGLLETEINIVIRAENDNARAHASFSDTSFFLAFHGVRIAQLVAGAFDVAKNDTKDFNYVVQSSSIPLDPEVMEDVDYSLKRNEIVFELKGDTRTRWRVGPLGSVKFPCHLNCQLHFHPLNGSYIRSRCSSKSK